MIKDVGDLQPLLNAWSIAGSDNSAGAGIQADNQVFQAFGLHACNIITALTVQNSQKVELIHQASAEQLQKQMQSIADEYSPSVIKLGMLPNAEIMTALEAELANKHCPVVCDPVLSASTGDSLAGHVQGYLSLLPHIDVLTPNHKEFVELFTSDVNDAVDVSSREAMLAVASRIAKTYDLQLVITGGDLNSAEDGDLDNDQCSDFVEDLCVWPDGHFIMRSPKVVSDYTHGTGCSFSSALAAALARNYSFYEACVLAKAYMNKGFSLSSSLPNEGICRGFVHAGVAESLSYMPQIAIQNVFHSAPFNKIDTLSLGSYPVVDTIEWIERCLKAGVKTLQLRIKSITGQQLDTMVSQAVELGKQYQARLFINDYWQLAIKHGAYGVHLGQEDLDTADLDAIREAGLHLGVSTHSWFELARAHSIKPSYIAIGPIYETTTKDMPFSPQGLNKLSTWLKAIGDDYPVVAIGGIDLSNAADVRATGVGSVAMVRAVTEAEDYKAAVKAFDALFEAEETNY